MPELIEIRFDESDFAPVRAQEGKPLSRVLTATNSPVLFGCRTGICGTCRIEIVESAEALAAPSALELETLELYAPENPRARLACQLNASRGLCIKKLG